MPMTSPYPIDYSKKDYHYYYNDGNFNDICVCDLCKGMFRHLNIPYSTKLNNCNALKKIEDAWLCIHCQELS